MNVGFFNEDLVDDLLRECTKMQEFDHPNVLTMIGVCLDGGPAPYIVMPFMSSGSLLSHLKENRETLIVQDSSLDDPSDIVSQCLDHAPAMLWLLYVHRLSHERSFWICVFKWPKEWSTWPARE